MAVYRYQVVSVGLWRGKIKRWNTTFHSQNNAATPSFYNIMNQSGYKAPGDVAGACSGGVASITVYNVTGGPPVLQTVYFDWETPSAWIPYDGSLWSGVPAATPLDAAGESALVVVGNMGGLSASGKPVKTRKFLHAVPSRSAASYSDPDVDATSLAAFQAAWTPAYLQNPQGVVPVSATVLEYYGNHQRVRGRRKTVAQTAANAFTLGVLAGGGATTSGQGDQFPGGEY